MTQLWDRIIRRRAPAHDPLVTLELQAQLGRLLVRLYREERHTGFAGAHHARAARSAYESTLRSAVRLAGADDTVHPDGDIIGLELDLSSRGWLW